jgi:hypothetical protein
VAEYVIMQAWNIKRRLHPGINKSMVPTEDEYNKLSANYQSFLSNIVDVL